MNYNLPKPHITFTNYNLNTDGVKYKSIGKDLLKNNKVAVIILAGGQGTRLGTNKPKGTYELPIKKSLFDIHVENVIETNKIYKSNIPIYIMTSDATHEETVKYCEKYHEYKNIHFMKQESSVCFDMDNRPLPFYDGYAKAPTGNGAIFKTMAEHGLFSNTTIDYYNVISVDNVLARICDPVFIGYMKDKNLEIASKTVDKLEGENTGIFLKTSDNYLLVNEYSEITEEEHKILKTKIEQEITLDNDSYMRDTVMGIKLDEDPVERVYKLQANICNHLFKRSFMEMVSKKSLPAHKAVKKIPYTVKNGDDYEIIYPNVENGYKNEFFIFDSFSYSCKNGIMNVPRIFDFSPLKNGLDKECDNPRTCVEDLYKRSEILIEKVNKKKNIDKENIDKEKVLLLPCVGICDEFLEKYKL